MEYQITVTEDEYIRFNVFHAQRTAAGRRKKLLWVYLICFLVVLASVIAARSPELYLIGALWLVLVLILGFFSSSKGMEMLIRRNIRKMWKDGKLPYQTNATVVFQEDQILWQYDRGTLNIPYSDIENAYQDQGFLYLYYGVQQALLLPERCLNGDTEKVIRLIAEKTGKYPACG